MALILHSPFLLLLPSVQAAWSHREVRLWFGDVGSSTCKERYRLTPDIKYERYKDWKFAFTLRILWRLVFCDRLRSERNRSISAFPSILFLFSGSFLPVYKSILPYFQIFFVQCVNLSDAR